MVIITGCRCIWVKVVRWLIAVGVVLVLIVVGSGVVRSSSP